MDPSPSLPPAPNKKRIWLRRCLWSLLIFTTSILLLAGVVDQLGAHASAASGPYDLIIVAGAGVLPDGTPSWSLQARVAVAVKQYKAHMAPKILMTGGTSDSSPTEASVAATLAIEAGVPRDDLILEDKSRTTYENARFARDLALGANKILLVTDSFHIPRARRVFARFFPSVDATPSFVPPGYRIYGSLRELPATAWYFVNGRL